MTFLEKYGLWIGIVVLVVVSPELFPICLAAALVDLAVKYETR